MSRRAPDVAAVAFVDERLAAAGPARKLLRYVFPDHWSFLLGEVALYSFAILVVTGTFLALEFDPSTALTTWTGPYAPLSGTEVSGAYASALDLSFTVPGGLLVRQTHHWAALLFLVAITAHLFRILFTGAFRKPRELNYLVGLTLLLLAMVEGFLGYSLLDDLISGMGLAIGYGVALSTPFLGGPIGAVFWDGQFPGGDAFLSRLFAIHVFVLPALIAGLIGLHLLSIVTQRHTQFPGRRRREGNVIGSPLWPAYALRALGLFVATAAALVLLGGLVQINPVWQWGPYDPWVGENGAQPDLYLGWLIGALRLVPSYDLVLFDRTIAPNPFFGGLLYPAVVFGVLYLFPWLDRRWFTPDRRAHHLLERPRDNPRRSAFLVAAITFVGMVLLFGAADRLFYATSFSYQTQTWAGRVLVLVVPLIAHRLTLRACRELLRREGGSGPASDGTGTPPASVAAPRTEEAEAADGRGAGVGSAHPLRAADAVAVPPPAADPQARGPGRR